MPAEFLAFLVTYLGALASIQTVLGAAKASREDLAAAANEALEEAGTSFHVRYGSEFGDSWDFFAGREENYLHLARIVEGGLAACSIENINGAPTGPGSVAPPTVIADFLSMYEKALRRDWRLHLLLSLEEITRTSAGTHELAAHYLPRIHKTLDSSGVDYRPAWKLDGSVWRAQSLRLWTSRPFGGRGEELGRLDHFVGQEDPRCLLVTGPSGVGKTALLAHWIEGLSEAGTPTCHHFLSPLVSHSCEEAVTFRNLCEQLAALNGVSLPPHASVVDLRRMYLELLATAQLRETGLVVVIDGLDEAQGWEPGPDIVPRPIPLGTHLVLSARELADRDWLDHVSLSHNQAVSLVIKNLGESQIRDLLAVSGFALARRASEEGFVSALHAVSGGDPYHVGVLLEDLLERPETTVSDLANARRLPGGYLDKWWEEVCGAGGEAAVRALLGYLVAAQGGRLTRDDLIQMDEGDALDAWTIGPALQLVRRHVVGNVVDGYAIGHERFRLYIAAYRLQGPLLATYAERLLLFCARWPEHRSAYARAHYARLLSDVGRTEELYGLIDYPWARFKLVQSGDVEGFARDLTLVMDLAASDDSSEGVVHLIRASLIQEMLRVKLSVIPFDLLGALASVHRVSEALGYASLQTNWFKRSAALREIAKACIDSGDRDGALEALRLAWHETAFLQPWNGAHFLLAVVPLLLKADAIEEAIAAAAEARDRAAQHGGPDVGRALVWLARALLRAGSIEMAAEVACEAWTATRDFFSDSDNRYEAESEPGGRLLALISLLRSCGAETGAADRAMEILEGRNGAWSPGAADAESRIEILLAAGLGERARAYAVKAFEATAGRRSAMRLATWAHSLAKVGETSLAAQLAARVADDATKITGPTWWVHDLAAVARLVLVADPEQARRVALYAGIVAATEEDGEGKVFNLLDAAKVLRDTGAEAAALNALSTAHSTAAALQPRLRSSYLLRVAKGFAGADYPGMARTISYEALSALQHDEHWDHAMFTMLGAAGVFATIGAKSDASSVVEMALTLALGKSGSRWSLLKTRTLLALTEGLVRKGKEGDATTVARLAWLAARNIECQYRTGLGESEGFDPLNRVEAMASAARALTGVGLDEEARLAAAETWEVAANLEWDRAASKELAMVASAEALAATGLDDAAAGLAAELIRSATASTRGRGGTPSLHACRLLCSASSCLLVSGTAHEASAAARDARQMALGVGDPHARALGLALAGRVLRAAGADAEASVAGLEALDSARILDGPDSVDVQLDIAGVLIEMCSPAEAALLATEALLVVDKIDDPYSKVRLASRASSVLSMAGRNAEGRVWATKAQSGTTQLVDGGDRAEALTHSAVALFEAGDDDNAGCAIDEAWAIVGATPRQDLKPASVMTLASTAAKVGRVEMAVSASKLGIALASDRGHCMYGGVMEEATALLAETEQFQVLERLSPILDQVEDWFIHSSLWPEEVGRAEESGM
ncbi:MAG: AAA family ATPase [Thermoleophilia bacterium]